MHYFAMLMHIWLLFRWVEGKQVRWAGGIVDIWSLSSLV
jgi:hypothetical protein